MRLILLVGMNKTGSSAMQSSLYLSRYNLLEFGYFLPESKYDHKMKEGLISPGNGANFARILAARNEIGLQTYLEMEKRKAVEHNCHSIILSNEVLIRMLSKQELINLAERVFLRLEFDVNLLCIHRNVYQHALSLYKHRAKSGEFNSYQEWFTSDYETIWILKNFLGNTFPLNWRWTHKSYENGIRETFISFLKDLGFTGILIWPTKIVNFSLSLGELKFITTMEKDFKGIAPMLVSNMQKYVMHRKDCSSELNGFQRDLISFLKNEQTLLNKWAGLLSKQDQIFLLKKPEFQKDHNKVGLNLPLDWDKAWRETLNQYRASRVQRNFKRVYVQFLHYFSFLRKETYDKHEFGGSL